MKAIILTEESCININGALIPKNVSTVTRMTNGVRLSGDWGKLDILADNADIDGVPAGSVTDLFNYFKANSFSSGSGGGVTQEQLDEAISGIDIPTWNTISDKPAIIASGATAAAARTAIGAGTGNGSSNLAIGATASTAMAGNKVPTATQRGGVLLQADIVDLEAEPTMEDYNALLAKLRSAGIFG